MELSESQVIESMKKTMQRHEHIFKQQVQELHRLYHLQKMLMHELENEQSWTRNETAIVSQSFCKRHDPTTELSGSCSGESSRLVNKVEDDLEVELTLRIGHCTRAKKSRSHLQECNQQFLDFDTSNPPVDQESSSLSRINTGKDESYEEASAALNQDSGQPHWLLQDLSLNRR